MKCILHIGSAKTGTSSLQELLYENREVLKADGCLYPASCLWRGDRSHNSLGIYFWDNLFESFKTAPFLTVAQTLLEEMAGWSTVIISTELIEKAILYGNPNALAFIAMLRSHGYDIEVVYGIRRYDHFLDSFFKQSVGDPYVLYAGSPTNFVAANAPYIKYGATAKAWRSIPGIARVAIVPFYENGMRDNLSRLIAELGYPALIGPQTPIPYANRSFEGEFLRLRQALNGFDLPMAINHDLARLAMSPQAAKLSSAKTSLFSSEERKTLLQSYGEDCRTLRDEFGVDLARWFDVAEPQAVPFVPLRREEIPLALKAIAHLDEELFDKIANLIA
jgi:hypothetical protein